MNEKMLQWIRQKYFWTAGHFTQVFLNEDLTYSVGLPLWVEESVENLLFDFKLFIIMFFVLLLTFISLCWVHSYNEGFSLIAIILSLAVLTITVVGTIVFYYFLYKHIVDKAIKSASKGMFWTKVNGETELLKYAWYKHRDKKTIVLVKKDGTSYELHKKWDGNYYKSDKING